MNRKKIAVAVVLLIMIGLLTIGGCIYYNRNRFAPAPNLVDNVTSTVLQNSPMINESKSDSSTIISAQNEKIKTLEQLMTYDWAVYKNDDLGFYFKYPSYISICPASSGNIAKGGSTMIVVRLREPCNVRDIWDVSMLVEGNVNGYSSAQEAFYKVFPDISSTSTQFDLSKVGYFTLGGLDAYGGAVPVKNNGNWVVQSNYYAVILKNNILFKISDNYYNVSVGGNPSGDKPILDTMLSTLYFDPLHSPFEVSSSS